MKLYRALEERGLPLAFHAATNWGDQSMHITNRFIATHALGFTWFNIVHMTNWVVNGIPERFPGLKSIWIESGLAWIPFLMQRLDNEYMMRSSEAPSLKRKPSDYMREMYYTSQPMEMIGNQTMLEETFKMIAAETQLALLVRLSALGHGPAVDDLRPAVPEPAGEKEHPGRKRAQAVQARHADLGREEGAAEGEGRGGVGLPLMIF